MLVDGVPAKFPRRTLTLVCLVAITGACTATIADVGAMAVDCEDASESCEQAVICQGGVYDYSQSVC